LNVVIAADQMVNALLRGDPDETLSSRAYRMHLKGHPYWGWLANAIDALFFWQRAPRHCERAYLSEVERRQFPDVYAGNI
jgi:hypothetical protein